MQRLPEKLRSLGATKGVSNGYSYDAKDTIPDIQALLRLGVQYEFTTLTAAVKSTLAQHAVGSSATVSRLLKHMKETCLPWPDTRSEYFTLRRAEWRLLLNDLLTLAHAHKIYAMLPGLYCLFLALDGPLELSRNGGLSMSDRLRCSTGFHFLYSDICRLGGGKIKQPASSSLDHQALWEFSCLTVCEQECVWRSLPGVFQLPSWDDLWTSPNLNISSI